jgi:hypothetical protein
MSAAGPGARFLAVMEAAHTGPSAEPIPESHAIALINVARLQAGAGLRQTARRCLDLAARSTDRRVQAAVAQVRAQVGM